MKEIVKILVSIIFGVIMFSSCCKDNVNFRVINSVQVSEMLNNTEKVTMSLLIEEVDNEILFIVDYMMFDNEIYTVINRYVYYDENNLFYDLNILSWYNTYTQWSLCKKGEFFTRCDERFEQSDLWLNNILINKFYESLIEYYK